MRKRVPAMSLALTISFAAVLAGAAFSAFFYGGQEERRVCILLLLASLISPIVQQSVFSSTEYGILLVDGIVFLILGYGALFSDKYWPMFAAGFQLTIVLMHIPMSGSVILPLAYADLSVLWSYFVLISLVFGSFYEERAI